MIERVSSLLRKQVPDVTAEGLLFASGEGVPSDGVTGYQTGCIYQRVDGGANTAFYINEGDNASSTWVVAGTLTSAQQEFLTSVTAGTVTASKAVVVDADKDIEGFRNVEIGGTLKVDGEVEMVEVPKLTETEDAEAQTLTMTKGPAAAEVGKDDPIYLKVKVGTTTHVIPAWPLA